jgi:hypothetical protein
MPAASTVSYNNSAADASQDAGAFEIGKVVGRFRGEVTRISSATLRPGAQAHQGSIGALAEGPDSKIRKI